MEAIGLAGGASAVTSMNGGVTTAVAREETQVMRAVASIMLGTMASTVSEFSPVSYTVSVANGEIVTNEPSSFVGDEVGLTVGAVLGVAVGATVGTFVGTIVGAFVGTFVGTVVGEAVGAQHAN